MNARNLFPRLALPAVAAILTSALAGCGKRDGLLPAEDQAHLRQTYDLATDLAEENGGDFPSLAAIRTKAANPKYSAWLAANSTRMHWRGAGKSGASPASETLLEWQRNDGRNVVITVGGSYKIRESGAAEDSR